MIKINVARICLGVSLACVFLAIIFDIWSLQDEAAKAQIGSIVFQVIVMFTLITVMVLTQFLTLNQQQQHEEHEEIIKN
jgi:formate hydrogenlyase subunit 4